MADRKKEYVVKWKDGCLQQQRCDTSEQMKAFKQKLRQKGIERVKVETCVSICRDGVKT